MNELKALRNAMLHPVALASTLVAILLVAAFVWQAAIGLGLTWAATFLLFDMMDRAEEHHQGELFNTPNAMIRR